MTACPWRSWERGWRGWQVPQGSRKSGWQVSLATRWMVVAIEHVCPTSAHSEPPGDAPSSDPLSPASPHGGMGRRGDAQKRKFLDDQVPLLHSLDSEIDFLLIPCSWA